MPAPWSQDRPVRWGVMGAGWIAERLSEDIGRTSGNVVTAVSARDAGRAADFASRHGAPRSYGSYAELVRDEEVDVVYVATTHPNHLANALLAIQAGKAVLIEKPVGLNAAEAREIFAAATASDVFAMEAMWMRANPLIRLAQRLVADGEIGEIIGLRAEFGLGLPFDPVHRLYDLANGGGALLDLGIYPVTFGYLFLGRPDEVRTAGALSPAGADEIVAMQWVYQGTPRAHLLCSVSAALPNEAAVYGRRGWIRFAPAMHRPSALTVHTATQEYQVEDPIAGQGWGYVPQIEEVERCLRAGLRHSPLVPPADTIAILELLDEARAVLGVTYPRE